MKDHVTSKRNDKEKRIRKQKVSLKPKNKIKNERSQMYYAFKNIIFFKIFYRYNLYLAPVCFSISEEIGLLVGPTKPLLLTSLSHCLKISRLQRLENVLLCDKNEKQIGA